jgi:transcription antitermination factor NusG
MGRRRHGRVEHREADPYWACVRFLPNHDRLALAALALGGYEVFMPRTRTLVALRWRTVPLFAGYLFTRVVNGQWRPIERTAGILAVVRFDETPARVPDTEIGKLISRASADGIVRLPQPRARRPRREGMRVLITEGALRGFEGLHTGLSAGERELILLNVLGAPRQVAVAADALRAAR